jgi:hypothetical protein
MSAKAIPKFIQQKSLEKVLVDSSLSAKEIFFEHEDALSRFFDGSSVASSSFEAAPKAITSEGVVWGDNTNGVILESSITDISTIDELVDSIETGLETGRFRSLSIYDNGAEILTLTGNSMDWTLSSSDLSFNLVGTLPTSMSGLFDFLDSLRKIPDFFGVEETTYWDSILQTWVTEKDTPLGLSDNERDQVINTLKTYYLDKIELIKDDELYLSLVSEAGETLVEWDGIPLNISADISTASLGTALEDLANLQEKTNLGLTLRKESPQEIDNYTKYLMFMGSNYVSQDIEFNLKQSGTLELIGDNSSEKILLDSAGHGSSKQVEFNSVKIDGVTDFNTQISSSTADGSPISISDVVSQLRDIVGLDSLTGKAKAAADIDNDGEVQISDVVSNLRHIVGLDQIDTFDLVTDNGFAINALHANSVGNLSLVINGDADQSHSEFIIA